jgi:hypothetical protein
MGRVMLEAGIESAFPFVIVGLLMAVWLWIERSWLPRRRDRARFRLIQRTDREFRELDAPRLPLADVEERVRRFMQKDQLQ